MISYGWERTRNSKSSRYVQIRTFNTHVHSPNKAAREELDHEDLEVIAKDIYDRR